MINIKNKENADGGEIVRIPDEDQLLASGLVDAIEKSNGRIHVMLSGDGLSAVSLAMVEKIRSSQRELERKKPTRNEDALISKEEAKAMLRVCDTTLWAWARKGYLKVHKVGSRVRYRLGDILQLVEANH